MPNIPTSNSNPGDLRGQGGSFQNFGGNDLAGQAALYNDLTAKMTGNSKTGLNGNSTLYEFAQKYDPKGDGNNDPVNYAAKLANQLGISPDTKIGTLMPRIDDFARAVANNEGYQGKWAGNNDTKSGLQTSTLGANETISSNNNEEQQWENKEKNTPPGQLALETGGRMLTQTLLGLGKSIAATGDQASQLSQGLMSKLIPGGAPISSLKSNITQPTNPSQEPGYFGGLIGQLLTGSEGAAETGGTSLTNLAKDSYSAIKNSPKIGKLIRLAKVAAAIKGGYDTIKGHSTLGLIEALPELIKLVK